MSKEIEKPYTVQVVPNFFERQRIRFLSHITFGKRKKHYKNKWHTIKTNLFKNKNILNSLSNLIFHIYEKLSYTRVPGFDKPQTVYQFVSNIVLCSELHKRSFSSSRFINYGRDVVVCATGPTFDYFEPIQNAFYIGVNHAYRTDKAILFDALFCQDAYTVFNGKVPADFIEYRGMECHKFFGNQQPLSYEADPRGTKINYYMSENNFNYLIDTSPLPDFTSVVFSAFSYALWTTPKRIFIVGADCSNGHASSLNATHGVNDNLKRLIVYWEKMKVFAQRFYPDIEIISVNPIGLKGLFYDVYTESYLADHPEIDRASVEILNEGKNL